MSDAPMEKVCRRLGCPARQSDRLGCPLENAFMTLSFLALPVIPNLKSPTEDWWTWISFKSSHYLLDNVIRNKFNMIKMIYHLKHYTRKGAQVRKHKTNPKRPIWLDEATIRSGSSTKDDCRMS